MRLKHLLFPPECVHCGERTQDSHYPLCLACIQTLERLEPEDRCPRCGAEQAPQCRRCGGKGLGFWKAASVFASIGPITTLLEQFRNRGQSELSSGLAGWMALHFFKLNYPSPDLIIPVPQVPCHSFSRGYNPAALLAEQLSPLLQAPVSDCLRRTPGYPAQTHLPSPLRKQLPPDAIHYHPQEALQGKTVLLVDDLMKTGATLRLCAEKLRPHFPKMIVALTLCGH